MSQLMTQEEERAEQAGWTKQSALDWFEMMQSPAAERIWLQLLQELGAGRLMVTENDMRMRNVSDQILNRMHRPCLTSTSASCANFKASNRRNISCPTISRPLLSPTPVPRLRAILRKPRPRVGHLKAVKGRRPVTAPRLLATGVPGLPEGWGEKLKDVGSAEEALKALERGLGYRQRKRSRTLP